jgi:DNA-binding response OmpR family regulator
VSAVNIESQRKKRILVAEDDPAIATLLERALGKLYEVELATDGTTALNKATNTERVPDLVLLDVMMPGLDGLGVAQRMRMLPKLKKVPIIFITAKSAPMDVVRGIQAGARAYITKPFKLDDLMAKVKKAIGE